MVGVGHILQLQATHARGENAVITFTETDYMFQALRQLRDVGLTFRKNGVASGLWFSVSKSPEARNVVRALRGLANALDDSRPDGKPIVELQLNSRKEIWGETECLAWSETAASPVSVDWEAIRREGWRLDRAELLQRGKILADRPRVSSANA